MTTTRSVSAGVLLALSLAVAGCGTASPSQSDDPTALCARVDAGGVVAIAAQNLEFDAPCIVAEADTAFTIRLTVNENLPHNVTVYVDDTRAEQIYRGEIFSGPNASMDYSIPALAAGEYWFDCFLHPPNMNGILYVE